MIINNKGRVTFAPPTHANVPPRQRERERKINSGSLVAATAIYGALTESIDAVDSIYEAIPSSARRASGPIGKVEAIYANFDKIDWVEAIKNLLENQLEDRIVGRSIGATTKAYRRYNKSTGRNDPWTGSKVTGIIRAGGL